MAKAPKVVPLGVAIDALYAMRDLRIEKARAVDEMKRLEKVAARDILDRLKLEKSLKSSGQSATFSITKSVVPVPENWVKLYAYIKKTGEFELLHQRIASTAWGERHAAGIKVPGIEAMEKEDYSLTKITRSQVP